MRAKQPHTVGHINQQGVKLHYEVYGNGERTMVFVPTWSIVHSRNYKGQIAYFSQYFRCIALDPRGNGLSDKPEESMKYRLKDYTSDVLALMDEVGAENAILFCYSLSSKVSSALAYHHPERIEAIIAIGSLYPLGKFYDHMMNALTTAPGDNPQGWQKYNPAYWSENYSDFADFFISEIFQEPHSTKQIEDSLSWASTSNGNVLKATSRVNVAENNDLVLDDNVYLNIKCPVLLIHGEKDNIIPCEHSRQLSKLIPNNELVIIEGAGHAPHGRIPAKINILARDFLIRNNLLFPEQISKSKTPKSKQILILSSPIGLGHGRRDIAIAQSLRKIYPDIQIHWLAQDPVTRLLAANNEIIHPASKELACESEHIESEAGEHDLNAFQALRNMDEILVANFMVIQEVVEQVHYDLIIADESWELDHFWHEHPELKKTAVAWLTDFVGFIPMPEGGEREAFLTRDYNLEMIQHVEHNPSVRDRAIFVGNPIDIIAHDFGSNLPTMRDWIPKHFDFCGYILGQHPQSFGSKAELRARFSYHTDEKVCIVTVGGSGVGSALIEMILDAYPIAKNQSPELRMIVVTGPRLDPQRFALPLGVEAHAFVPNLDQHLAACDLALVQGGLTTSMELVAANTPFIYFPLKNHFEQNYHVAHRLDQYHAGRKMIYSETSPELIAEAIIQQLSMPQSFKVVESDGAERAAKMLAELF